MRERFKEWSPAPGLVVFAWILTLAAAAWFVALTISDSDPAGRVLAGVATVSSAVAAFFGTRARPRLRADVDGLTISGPFRTRHHPWPLVQNVRVLQVRRLGRRTSLLEIDTLTADGEERLLVFGRLELAADPEDVAPELLALRP